MKNINISDVKKLISNYCNMKNQPGFKIPCIFMYGSDKNMLEDVSMELADELKKQDLIPFEGQTKFFSIIMPYLDSKESAEHFVAHIMQSIDVAKGYYTEFKGAIVVELAEKWSELGYNRYFDVLTDLIRATEKDICFIVISLEKKHHKKSHTIYDALGCCSVWQKINCSMNEQDYAEKFSLIAKANGYKVKEKTRKYIVNTINSSAMESGGILNAFDAIIRQIKYNRAIEMNKDDEIRIEDFANNLLFKNISSSSDRKIGFTVNRI